MRRWPEKEQRSIPVYELPFEERIALVFGNEVSGVSEEFERQTGYEAEERELDRVRIHGLVAVVVDTGLPVQPVIDRVTVQPWPRR